MSDATAFSEGLRRFQRGALAAGCAGTLGCIVGAVVDHSALLGSYLISFVFWTGIGLGCLGFLLLHHMVGGPWGVASRRILEAGAATLALMCVLFLPLVLGVHSVYPWARPEAAGDALILHKRPYLNVPFFVARTVIAFAAWLFFATRLRLWGRASESLDDPRDFGRKIRKWCGAGMVAFVLLATVVAIDWIMSLDPDWFSTMFGLTFVAGALLSGVCFVVIVLAVTAEKVPDAGVDASHFHDLGNFLLTFVLLWAYMAFCEFLIIWFGNLADDVTRYVRRTSMGWQAVAATLIGLHFAAPCFILLSRTVKRSGRRLAWVAGGILAMRVVENFWAIAPAFRPQGPSFRWFDPACFAAIGGFWLAFFANRFRSAEPVPRILLTMQERPGHA